MSMHGNIVQPKKKVRRSNEGCFDFKTKCFICTKGKKNREGPGGVLHMVTKPTFQTNLEAALKAVYDENCKTILLRISCVNLITEEASYHKSCHTEIMNKYLGIDKTGPVGRPKLDISDSMEKVFDYMESCDDKCFTMQELMDLIGEFKLKRFSLIISFIT